MTGGREAGWGPGRRLALGLARGLAMGAADVVPGVSGGTIAVVLGIYERLLGAIREVAGAAGRLLRGDWREAGRRLATVDWWLIVPLLVGILGTIVLLASVIETQLESAPRRWPACSAVWCSHRRCRRAGCSSGGAPSRSC